MYGREQAGESMEEDDMVKSMAIASYGDETMRREGGLQARVRVKRYLTIPSYKYDVYSYP